MCSTLVDSKNFFRKGFTLIEMLVVIAILGLLATVGLGSFQTSQMKSRDAQRKNDLSQIQKALELYYNDHGRYLPPPLPAAGGSWQDASGTIYMKLVPSDPKYGAYLYLSDNDGTWYKLYARLENTQDPKYKVYGVTCGGDPCNYGVASSNMTP